MTELNETDVKLTYQEMVAANPTLKFGDNRKMRSRESDTRIRGIDLIDGRMRYVDRNPSVRFGGATE